MSWWAIESVFLCSPDKGYGHVWGSTPGHALTAGDLGLAVQFDAGTPWRFAQLCYPRVG